MGEPRKITDQQRAAHLLLPLVVGLVDEMKGELAEMVNARVKGRNKDAEADWSEMIARAEGRYRGGLRVARMLQALVRG